LGTLDSDKSIAVEIAHDKDLDLNKDAYVQLAVLHTSRSGERRVRTINLALGTSSLGANVFRYADVDACTVILYKQGAYGDRLLPAVLINRKHTVISRLASRSLETIKETLTKTCASILLSYRQQCAASAPPTQVCHRALSCR